MNQIILQVHAQIALMNFRQFNEAACCTNHTATMHKNRSKPDCRTFIVKKAEFGLSLFSFFFFFMECKFFRRETKLNLSVSFIFLLET